MVPVAVRTLVMEVDAGGMVSTKVAEPEPPALVAKRVGENVPVTVGVPEMTPVAVFTLNPVGSEVALKLVGLLVAVMG